MDNVWHVFPAGVTVWIGVYISQDLNKLSSVSTGSELLA